MEISARPSLLHLLSEGPLQSLNPTRACVCLDPSPQLPSTPSRVKPKLLNLTFQVLPGPAWPRPPTSGPSPPLSVSHAYQPAPSQPTQAHLTWSVSPKLPSLPGMPSALHLENCSLALRFSWDPPPPGRPPFCAQVGLGLH